MLLLVAVACADPGGGHDSASSDLTVGSSVTVTSAGDAVEEHDRHEHQRHDHGRVDDRAADLERGREHDLQRRRGRVLAEQPRISTTSAQPIASVRPTLSIASSMNVAGRRIIGSSAIPGSAGATRAARSAAISLSARIASSSSRLVSPGCWRDRRCGSIRRTIQRALRRPSMEKATGEPTSGTRNETTERVTRADCIVALAVATPVTRACQHRSGGETLRRSFCTHRDCQRRTAAV